MPQFTLCLIMAVAESPQGQIQKGISWFRLWDGQEKDQRSERSPDCQARNFWGSSTMLLNKLIFTLWRPRRVLPSNPHLKKSGLFSEKKNLNISSVSDRHNPEQGVHCGRPVLVSSLVPGGSPSSQVSPHEGKSLHYCSCHKLQWVCTKK